KAIEKVNLRTAPIPIAGETVQGNASEQEFVFVKDGTKIIKVKYDDILYVEGLKDYVVIHTPNKKITSLQRMKAMETELPEAKFIRIHNSFIVALDAIESIQKNEVLIGGKLLPISDTYKKSFM